MNAAEWIEKVKNHTGIASDYGVAKAVGLSRQALSDIRNGRTTTLGEDSAIRVAQALGAPPEVVVLDQYAERTKSPAVRAALLSAVHRLYIM